MDRSLPIQAFVPGGPFPRPDVSPDAAPAEIDPLHWRSSVQYRWGIDLFNNGYYWEAHEVWEGLWHVHGRRGPIADLLKGLIKLAAAGVKVRQGQAHGVVTHASRAAVSIDATRSCVGPNYLGLNLDELVRIARQVEAHPPTTIARPSDGPTVVFPFALVPA